jgi:hypothetical protein
MPLGIELLLPPLQLRLGLQLLRCPHATHWPFGPVNVPGEEVPNPAHSIIDALSIKKYIR